MPSDPAVTPSAADEWAALVVDLPRHVLNELVKHVDLAAPSRFLEFATQALEADAGGVSRILLEHNLVIRAASDPAMLGESQAIALVQLAARRDARLGVRLIRNLSSANRVWPKEVPEDEALRVLALLENLSGLESLVIPLLKFTQHPSKKVRSKGAKLIGKVASTVSLFERVFADTDARVRANLVEGIALGQTAPNESVIQFLRSASNETAPRVAAMALYALANFGEPEAADRLKSMCSDLDPATHKSAQFAWRLLQESPKRQSAA